jgi:hypothetical protein
MNFCPECGSQLDPDSKFCPSCGHELSEFENASISITNPPPTPYIPPQSQVQPRYYPPSQVQPRYSSQSDTYGIVALIFGILGLCVLPIIGAIIAIAFGAMSRSRDPNSSTGKAGLVLGVLGILCWVIYFIAIFAMISSMFNSIPYY